MRAYLFLWNPKKDGDSFKNYDEVVLRAAEGEPYTTYWICPSKRPRSGDAAFVKRTGPRNRGLFARGIVLEPPFENDVGVRLVRLQLIDFLPLGKEIAMDELTGGGLEETNWNPMPSGTEINAASLQPLSKLWDAHSGGVGDEGSIPASEGRATIHEAPEPAAAPPSPRSDQVERLVHTGRKRFEPDAGTYRCLSVRQPHADLILRGLKPVEFRSWSTDHRGDVLLHAAATLENCDEVGLNYGPNHQWELGGYVGVIELFKIERVADADFHWYLRNPRRIAFRPSKGRLQLYKVDWPPSSAAETERRADHRTPGDRPLATDELLAHLPSEEVEAVIDYVECPDRDSLLEEFRYRFDELLQLIEPDAIETVVRKLGGTVGPRAAGNEKELRRLLRFVESIDCANELMATSEPEIVPIGSVQLDPEGDYRMVDGNVYHVTTDDDGAELRHLVLSGLVTEEGVVRYNYFMEDAKLWRRTVSTVGEVAAQRRHQNEHEPN